MLFISFYIIDIKCFVEILKFELYLIGKIYIYVEIYK